MNFWLSNDEGLYEMTNDFLRRNAGNWVYTIADRLKGDVENLAETRCSGVIETK